MNDKIDFVLAYAACLVDFETGFLSESFHWNQFDPESGLGCNIFSEVPKEIKFWLGSRETKSSTETKWSPENILVYNSTYYDMLEFNSMMKLMQSVSFMLLMLFL